MIRIKKNCLNNLNILCTVEYGNYETGTFNKTVHTLMNCKDSCDCKTNKWRILKQKLWDTTRKIFLYHMQHKSIQKKIAKKK